MRARGTAPGILSAQNTDNEIYDNGMTLEYKQGGNGNNSDKKITTETTAETLRGGREMAQSLDFAASLSSFFLCQLAAPILNLEGKRSTDQHRRAEPRGDRTAVD